MPQRFAIYKCSLCGNIVEVMYDGGGTLMCCATEMDCMEENIVDAAKEKHIPVLTKTDNGYEVKVGEVEHPSEEKHYIEWIELILNDGQSLEKFINPGEHPIAQFTTNAEVVTVRTYCNLHGLWKAN